MGKEVTKSVDASPRGAYASGAPSPADIADIEARIDQTKQQQARSNGPAGGQPVPLSGNGGMPSQQAPIVYAAPQAHTGGIQAAAKSNFERRQEAIDRLTKGSSPSAGDVHQALTGKNPELGQLTQAEQRALVDRAIERWERDADYWPATKAAKLLELVKDDPALKVLVGERLAARTARLMTQPSRKGEVPLPEVKASLYTGKLLNGFGGDKAGLGKALGGLSPEEGKHFARALSDVGNGSVYGPGAVLAPRYEQVLAALNANLPSETTSAIVQNLYANLEWSYVAPGLQNNPSGLRRELAFALAREWNPDPGPASVAKRDAAASRLERLMGDGGGAKLLFGGQGIVGGLPAPSRERNVAALAAVRANEVITADTLRNYKGDPATNPEVARTMADRLVPANAANREAEVARLADILQTRQGQELLYGAEQDSPAKQEATQMARELLLSDRSITAKILRNPPSPSVHTGSDPWIGTSNPWVNPFIATKFAQKLAHNYKTDTPALISKDGVPPEEAKKNLDKFVAAAMHMNPDAASVRSITEKIQQLDGSNPMITPLPLFFSSRSTGVVQLPLFRLHTKDGMKFVDNKGAHYSSFEEWRTKNELPSGLMVYPKDGHISFNADGSLKLVSEYTPETPDTVGEKVVEIIDYAALAGGTIAGAAVIIGTGGTAGVVFGAVGTAAAAWGAGRGGFELYERSQIGLSINPFTDGEARSVWLNGVSGLAGVAAFGSELRLMQLARSGMLTESSALRIARLRMGSNLADVTAFVNDGATVIPNVASMPPGEQAKAMMQMAFQAVTMGVASKEARSFGELISPRRAAQGMVETYGPSGRGMQGKPIYGPPAPQAEAGNAAKPAAAPQGDAYTGGVGKPVYGPPAPRNTPRGTVVKPPPAFDGTTRWNSKGSAPANVPPELIINQPAGPASGNAAAHAAGPSSTDGAAQPGGRVSLQPNPQKASNQDKPPASHGPGNADKPGSTGERLTSDARQVLHRLGIAEENLAAFTRGEKVWVSEEAYVQFNDGRLTARTTDIKHLGELEKQATELARQLNAETVRLEVSVFPNTLGEQEKKAAESLRKMGFVSDTRDAGLMVRRLEPAYAGALQTRIQEAVAAYQAGDYQKVKELLTNEAFGQQIGLDIEYDRFLYSKHPSQHDEKYIDYLVNSARSQSSSSAQGKHVKFNLPQHDDGAPSPELDRRIMPIVLEEWMHQMQRAGGRPISKLTEQYLAEKNLDWRPAYHEMDIVAAFYEWGFPVDALGTARFYPQRADFQKWYLSKQAAGAPGSGSTGGSKVPPSVSSDRTSTSPQVETKNWPLKLADSDNLSNFTGVTPATGAGPHISIWSLRTLPSDLMLRLFDMHCHQAGGIFLVTPKMDSSLGRGGGSYNDKNVKPSVYALLRNTADPYKSGLGTKFLIQRVPQNSDPHRYYLTTVHPDTDTLLRIPIKQNQDGSFTIPQVTDGGRVVIKEDTYTRERIEEMVGRELKITGDIEAYAISEREPTLIYVGLQRDIEAINRINELPPEYKERVMVGLVSGDPANPNAGRQIDYALRHANKVDPRGDLKLTFGEATIEKEGVTAQLRIGPNISTPEGHRNTQNLLKHIEKFRLSNLAGETIKKPAIVIHCDAGGTMELDPSTVRSDKGKVTLFDGSGNPVSGSGKLVLTHVTDYSNVEPLKDILRQHSDVNIVWAHGGGISRTGLPSRDHIKIIEDILNDKTLNHVHFDMAWDVIVKHILADPYLKYSYMDLINKYPDRFLWGSDTIGSDGQSVKGVLDLLWNSDFLQGMSGEARDKFLIGNSERIFSDSAEAINRWRLNSQNSRYLNSLPETTER